MRIELYKIILFTVIGCSVVLGFGIPGVPLPVKLPDPASLAGTAGDLAALTPQGQIAKAALGAASNVAASTAAPPAQPAPAPAAAQPAVAPAAPPAAPAPAPAAQPQPAINAPATPPAAPAQPAAAPAPQRDTSVFA